MMTQEEINKEWKLRGYKTPPPTPEELDKIQKDIIAALKRQAEEDKPKKQVTDGKLGTYIPKEIDNYREVSVLAKDFIFGAQKYYGWPDAHKIILLNTEGLGHSLEQSIKSKSLLTEVRKIMEPLLKEMQQKVCEHLNSNKDKYEVKCPDGENSYYIYDK